MAKRKKAAKRPDVNEIAARIVGVAVGEVQLPPPPHENAVRRGRARAASLSAKRRREIAKKAARARWKPKGR